MGSALIAVERNGIIKSKKKKKVNENAVKAVFKEDELILCAIIGDDKKLVQEKKSKFCQLCET